MAKRKEQTEVTNPVRTQRSGRPLRVLFNLHSYVPDQMSGAEMMAHRMAKYLAKVGHDVTVLTRWEDKDYEGVKVRNWANVHDVPEHIQELWENCDVVLTHLGQTGDSLNKTGQYKKQLVHIIHNTFDMPFVRVKIANTHIVYNSEWAREKMQYEQDSIILYPPTDYREFEKVDRKDAELITLINLNENKGGVLFQEIAKKMPDYNFLGVEGGYEHQFIDPLIQNVLYTPQMPDIRKALRETRILLVPSNYESWGLVAIEAASCGIPVIANPTPGLKESLADAGIWVDRNDTNGWVKAIKKLDDPKEYEKASQAVLARAKELDPLPQLARFEEFLQHVAKKPWS